MNKNFTPLSKYKTDATTRISHNSLKKPDIATLGMHTSFLHFGNGAL